MSDIAIRVEGLGKRYRIGGSQRHGTLRDTLTGAIAAPFQRIRSLLNASKAIEDESPADLIWALKDVSFEVPRGAVLGVIGRNGAGKSTLLKILSRITEPTEGQVEIHGRIGSLLEVGTGFHPELSGRENIYLNGAILGMRKADIAHKFDEIVAFAEIEKFIDMPVKHYSSGMYMRLAFAVAAHLDPEILVVDEVLAVGDAEFQKKCLGKMNEVSKSGRTILFVSHNMGAVASLCPRVIQMRHGQLAADGPARQVIQNFLFQQNDTCHTILSRLRLPGFGREIRFAEIKLQNARGTAVPFQQPLKFKFRVESEKDYRGLSIAGTIYNAFATPVATFFGEDTFDIDSGETVEMLVKVENFNLAPDHYHAGFSIGKGGVTTARHDLDIIIGAPSFQISPMSDGDIHVAEWTAGPWGNIVIPKTGLKILKEVSA